MNSILDICIWGAGKIGQECFKKIERYIGIECNFFFVDIDKNKVGAMYCGYSVYDINELLVRKKIAKESLLIIVAVPQKFFREIDVKISEWGLKRCCIYYSNNFTPTHMLKKIAGKPILPYMETHLTDSCNLSCKGCGHLSNIAPYKEFNISRFSSNLHRLKKLFLDIKKIRLMGGEPFLNSDIYEFAKTTRDIWHTSDIRIVTNGLLIDEKKISLLKKLTELDIEIDISTYPITMERMEYIEGIFKSAHIKYNFSSPIKEFMRFRNISGNNIQHDAYNYCPIKECTFMRDGLLSNCSFPVLYSQLDTFMKNVFSFTDKDTINLYDEDINGWDVVNRISNPIDACRYCSSNKIEFYEWEGFCDKNKAQVADWLLGEVQK